MVKRAWFAIVFVCFVIVLILVTHSVGAKTKVNATSVAHESLWMSSQFDRLQMTQADRQLASKLAQARPTVVVPHVPQATFSDPTSDLLFKWLTPDNDNYGLSVNGATLSIRLPDGSLGFPSTFYWNAVTFNMYDPNLALYDRVPDYTDAWFDGTPSSRWYNASCVKRWEPGIL